MDLVQVDVVRAQAPQRVLEFLAQPARAAVAAWASGAPLQPGLGGDERLAAQAVAVERLADDAFGNTEPIDRRRVDEVDAQVQGGADGSDGLDLVGAAPHPAADGPGAEPDARTLQFRTAQIDAFHVLLLCEGR